MPVPILCVVSHTQLRTFQLTRGDAKNDTTSSKQPATNGHEHPKCGQRTFHYCMCPSFVLLRGQCLKFTEPPEKSDEKPGTGSSTCSSLPTVCFSQAVNVVLPQMF